MSQRSIIKAESIQIGFHRATPVNQEPWTFAVPEAEITALVGPNGAGKTSLLLSLLGHLPLLSGRVWLPERACTVQMLPVAYWSEWFSFLPQDQLYRPEQSVSDHLRMSFYPRLGWFRALPRSAEERVQQELSQQGLIAHAEKPLSSLSSGERQRVFLARTLLANSRLVLLDEPTNHLDPGGTRRFWHSLVGDGSRGRRSFLISTHDMEFVRSKCHRVIALADGRLVFQGDTESFFQERWPEKIFT